MDSVGQQADHVAATRDNVFLPLDLGIARLAAVVQAAPVGVSLLPVQADDDGPGLVIVGGDAAAGQSADGLDKQALIGLFVQHGDGEALFASPGIEFRLDPALVVGQRATAFRYPRRNRGRVGAVSDDAPQVSDEVFDCRRGHTGAPYPGATLGAG